MSSFWMWHRRRPTARTGALVALILLIAPMPASARLGGDLQSIYQDQSRLFSALSSSQGARYAVYTHATPNSGTVIREYLSPSGVVFAVAWEGPVAPDLQALLGSSAFQAYADSARRRRGPVAVQQSGLVIEAHGMMRAVSGRAYLPDRIPAGVTVEELQ